MPQEEPGRDVAVLRPTGELAGAEAQRFLGELASAVGRGVAHLEVDLSGVSFADVAALGAIVDATARTSVRIVGANSTQRRVVEILDVEGRVTF